MDELKPCPFCGGVNIITWDPFSDTGDEQLVAHCSDCLADGPNKNGWNDSTDEAEAIAAWNTRTPANPVAGGLVERITAYLYGGGLLNPELADHAAVRDLLIECRDALEALGGGVEADNTEHIAVLKKWLGKQSDYEGDDPRANHYRRNRAALTAAIAALKEPT